MEKLKINDGHWTEKQSLKLINEFRLRPVLWDQKDPMYKNKTFYYEAWLDISNTIDIDHNSCIQQMSKLLWEFDKEKIRVSQKGVQTEWFGWNAMAFLHFTNYEKIKLVTGNYYYSENFETEIQKFKLNRKTSGKTDDLEDLDEDLKTFVKELTTKMKNYPTELRNRIKETIADVLKIADEEYTSVITLD